MKRYRLWIVVCCVFFGLFLRVRARQDLDPAVYSRKTMQLSGYERSYYVHLPPQYSAGKKLPMMLLFHGGGGGAPQALESYPLLEVADREGFILVAPNGTGRFSRELLRTWNVGFGFGYAQKNKVDDVGFVRSLILQLEKDYAVDPDRVYLTGLSNGAILSHWAGAANSDLVRGICPVVGTVAGREQGQGEMLYPVQPQKPVDVLLFNGDLDKNLPAQGGEQIKHTEGEPRVIASARESAEFWVKANHCNPKPVVEELSAQAATRYSWSGGTNGSRVVLYLLHNQGHAWPGGKTPRAVADKPSQLIKAHDVMWDFFSSKTK
jgi:polyhydroxybutyrate depolymerase